MRRSRSSWSWPRSRVAACTAQVDRWLHVEPLANSGTNYYPFLLVGVKIAGALALALLLARVTRVRAGAEAGERLLAALGHAARAAPPRLRPGLSPRSLARLVCGDLVVYLVHIDAEGIASGRWPLLAPWLHTYALPVFAVLSVVVAVVWALHALARRRRGATRAHVRRASAGSSRVRSHIRTAARTSASTRPPRRRFGLAFESRPPPLPA